jgi:hypothetical protein
VLIATLVRNSASRKEKIIREDFFNDIAVFRKVRGLVAISAERYGPLGLGFF